MSDETENLRRDDDDANDEASRSEDPGPSGAPAMVIMTTSSKAYPTTAKTFFACKPVTVGGTETEGQAGTFATGPGLVYCLNLGGSIPPMGTYLIATFVPNRWIFRYD